MSFSNVLTADFRSSLDSPLNTPFRNDSRASPKDSGTAEAQSPSDSVVMGEAAEELRQGKGVNEHSPIIKASPNTNENDGGASKKRFSKAGSGGFLLEPAPVQKTRKKRHERSKSGHKHERHHKEADRLSGHDQTVGGSLGQDGHGDHYQHNSRHNVTNIDPSDIVRMALSLNESRRISHGIGNSASQESPGRRNISAGLVIPLAPSPNSTPIHMGSLREYLNKPGSRHSNGRCSSPRSPPTRHSSGSHIDSGVVYQFSPGTLARADKARNFIQLYAEHRRLLESMPPLHPTKSNDYKYPEHANDANENISPLGRPYNPLQYLRNKRVRMREQMVLDPASMGWNDLYNVKPWVDSVQQRANRPGFFDGDVVHLPHPSASQRGRDSSFGPLLNQPGSDPFASKITRAKFDWSITPEGLLADTYWMEQDGHKAFIESASGNKIFERFRPPRQAQWTHSGERRLLQRSLSLTSQDSTISDDARNSFSLSAVNTRIDDFHDTDKTREKPVGYSRHAAAKVKHIFRRRTASSSSSGSATPDLETRLRSNSNRGRSSTAENIGPLERHMRQRQEAESSKRPSIEYDQLSPILTRQGTRRGGFSRQHSAQGEPSDATKQDGGLHESPFTFPASPSTADSEGPLRVSIDDFDDRQRTVKSSPPVSRKMQESRNSLKRKTRVPRFGFLRRGGSKAENSIDENDFALLSQAKTSSQKDQDNYSPASTASYPSKNNSYSSLPKIEAVSSRSRPGSQDQSTNHARRLFKGGRLGQLIRDEIPNPADGGSKISSSRKQSKASLLSVGLSDTEEQDSVATKNQLQRLRSFSSGDITKHDSFHIKNLPTFRSATATESSKELLKDLPSPVPEDKAGELDSIDSYIGRPEQRRMSRLQRLRADTPDSSDVSPNTSTLDVRQPRKSHRRSATSDAVAVDRGRDRSKDQSSSRSRSRVRSATGDRLQAVLESSGGIVIGGLPITGLSRLEANNAYPRSWGITQPRKSSESSPSVVTRKEVSYARCRLISTGIMAKGILQKANNVRNPMPDFLLQAVTAASTEIAPVVRRLEYATAANLFSKSLEKTVILFEKSAQDFQRHACNDLHNRIDDLRDKVTPNLAPAVQSCSDSVDAFIAELTTTKTMAVNQVNDAVDLMNRRRRRHLRFFKRGAFAMLEWTLVAIMWWIWLFVLLIRACRSLATGTIQTIKWFFWL